MTVLTVYSPDIKDYDFGPGHPFRGDRYANFMDLLKEKVHDYRIIEGRLATDEELMLVHDKMYIEFMDGEYDGRWYPSHRYLSPDTPLEPGMGRAARLIVGSSIVAGETACKDKTSCIGVGGGLHHARSTYGAGFCIYNDVAICALHLIKTLGLERVLILDTDAHAGDGTADIFYEDPRVLLIDLHQDPRTLYPGTGYAQEYGTGKGAGYTINVPMPPGASDAAYDYALREIFVPVANEFKPQIIIRTGGSDPHYADELTDLGLTLAGFHQVGTLVHEVAGSVCEGRTVDLLGSGYNQRVLPAAWLSIATGVAGLDIDLDEPLGQEPDRNAGLPATRNICQDVKRYLAPHWRSLS